MMSDNKVGSLSFTNKAAPTKSQLVAIGGILTHEQGQLLISYSAVGHKHTQLFNTHIARVCCWYHAGTATTQAGNDSECPKFFCEFHCESFESHDLILRDAVVGEPGILTILT
jgi:hypothetical protein